MLWPPTRQKIPSVLSVSIDGGRFSRPRPVMKPEIAWQGSGSPLSGVPRAIISAEVYVCNWAQGRHMGAHYPFVGWSADAPPDVGDFHASGLAAVRASVCANAINMLT